MTHRFTPRGVFTSTQGGRLIRNSCQIYSTIYLRKSQFPFFLRRWMITLFFRRVRKQDPQILQLQQENSYAMVARSMSRGEAIC